MMFVEKPFEEIMAEEMERRDEVYNKERDKRYKESQAAEIKKNEDQRIEREMIDDYILYFRGKSIFNDIGLAVEHSARCWFPQNGDEYYLAFKANIHCVYKNKLHNRTPVLYARYDGLYRLIKHDGSYVACLDKKDMDNEVVSYLYKLDEKQIIEIFDSLRKIN